MRATVAEYTQILQQLLPTGPAWPRDDDATLTKLLTGMAEGLTRAHNRLVDLLEEMDPRTANEMLTDWEAEFGLPTDCTAGLDLTVAERQATLHAQVTGGGGQSRQFYTDLAAKLGYEITITEFRPLEVGFEPEAPCCDEEWWFVWQVNAPETTIFDFEAGHSHAGEPLRAWGNERLECDITRRKPGHTHVLFAYGDD